MKNILSLLIVFTTYMNTWAFAQTNQLVKATLSQTEIASWQEDLLFMATEMEKYHANLFHTISKQKFYNQVNKLYKRIPDLTRDQVIVEMMRITAMVGDGHTNIYPTRDSKIGFHQLPIQLYFFSDGLFIRSATDDYKKLVGAQVLKIGTKTIEEAHQLVLEIIGKDNSSGARFYSQQLLAIPEILNALGLSESNKTSQFTLSINGKQSVVELKPYGHIDIVSGDIDKSLMVKDGWMDLRNLSNSGKIPLWLKNNNEKFWYEYDADLNLLYVQYNEVGDMENQTVEGFTERLFNFVDSQVIDKFVLDLRLNRGGNGGLNMPLLLACIKSKKINQRGKFFTIIGRSTFSAAQFLINDLEKYTEVLFVGEPSGSKGNIYGDSRKIILPNSKISVRVSVYQWQNWNPWDFRSWTPPHLTTELSSNDYRSSRDPAIEAIIGYEPGMPLKKILNNALDAGGVDLVLRKCKEFKSMPIHKYFHTEEALLEIGQKLLRQGKPGQAVSIFKLNVEHNPDSYISYYALGEAYAGSNQTELALINFKKALMINPKEYSVNQRYIQLKTKK